MPLGRILNGLYSAAQATEDTHLRDLLDQEIKGRERLIALLANKYPENASILSSAADEIIALRDRAGEPVPAVARVLSTPNPLATAINQGATTKPELVTNEKPQPEGEAPQQISSTKGDPIVR